MIYELFAALDNKFGFERAKAHCDIPCGIYDPGPAQIYALTVVRMIDLMNELSGNPGDKAYENSMARYIAVKEEHAEKVKHEIRVIWGDYLPKFLDKYPQLNDLTNKIMVLASKSRQTADRDNAVQLVDAVNQFAQIFWETKNVATKRAAAPYKPGLEMVYPDL